MLAEMSEARLPRLFIHRPDAITHFVRDDRRRVVLVQNGDEAVRQNEFGMRESTRRFLAGQRAGQRDQAHERGDAAAEDWWNRHAERGRVRRARRRGCWLAILRIAAASATTMDEY